MAKFRGIYKCEVCGNIVEVLHAGPGVLVCCSKDMKYFEEKTEDASTEKHVPFIQKTDEGVLVKIGQNQDHPMDEKHYIEWIQLITSEGLYRKFLSPGDKPQVVFNIDEAPVGAREYCNIHGLWKS